MLAYPWRVPAKRFMIRQEFALFDWLPQDVYVAWTSRLTSDPSIGLSEIKRGAVNASRSRGSNPCQRHASAVETVLWVASTSSSFLCVFLSAVRFNAPAPSASSAQSKRPFHFGRRMPQTRPQVSDVANGADGADGVAGSVLI